jgi:hypothetical protein
MTNSENGMRWLNEHLLGYAFTSCYGKAEQEFDGELAELTIPEPRNMFKTEPYEVFKLKQHNYKC